MQTKQQTANSDKKFLSRAKYHYLIIHHQLERLFRKALIIIVSLYGIFNIYESTKYILLIYPLIFNQSGKTDFISQHINDLLIHITILIIATLISIYIAIRVSKKQSHEPVLLETIFMIILILLNYFFSISIQ